MKATNNNSSVNVYQIVTNKIVEQLEKGVIPWHRPWAGLGVADGGAINYVTRKPYSLLNQMLLGREGEYLTFKQVKERGGSVKKGAKGNIVVFYTTSIKKVKREKKEDGTEEVVNVYEDKVIPILKYYNVFHISDCEGIKSKINTTIPNEAFKPLEQAENVVNGYVSRSGLKFQNNEPSNRAYYSPSSDVVVVPMPSQFFISEEYYSTTFHELTHSTMKKDRCNREVVGKLAPFGSEDYSREELVAEIGAAMLCNRVGIDCDKAFKNTIAYVQSWLRALKNDNKMIVWASSRAEKAAKFILNEE